MTSPLVKMKSFAKNTQLCPEYRIVALNMPPPNAVDIQFTNITLKVPIGIRSKHKKTILRGVSGHFKHGQLTAIMGPSGAGKSSLMNALTGFSTQGMTGTLRGGECVCELGQERSSRSFASYRKKSCYILQDDRLNPLFTVAELMRFAADMKLGCTFTEKMKITVIQEVLDTLGLSGTEDTRCGNLSGGQRKRLSIAVELIDNPPVVFLDEPTTGLDSLTSAQCIAMLKKLAQNGRTIVCTIHQPPASLYDMFDQVYILAEGLCIYNGSSGNTVPHLAALGFVCPKYHNPADYTFIAGFERGDRIKKFRNEIINLTRPTPTGTAVRSLDTKAILRQLGAGFDAIVLPRQSPSATVLEIANKEYGNFNEMLAQHCSQTQRDKPPPAPAPISDASTAASLAVVVNPPHELYKFGILFRRSLVQQYRDWTVTHLKVLLHIFIGVLLGMFYEKVGNDGSKTINNLGFFIISVAYLCYTSLMPAVLKFPSELAVLKKENFNNWYNLKTYYAAVLVTGMPIQIWYSFVYSAPSYFLSGQPLEPARFAMFVLVLANITLLADAVGNVIGTCVNPIGSKVNSIPTLASLVYSYSFVYSAPSYFLSGQPLEPARFAMFVLVLANITLLADAVGNVIGTYVNPINGTFIGAITTCAMIVFAGFLILFAHMNGVMRIISHFSFLRFGFEGLVLSIYSGGRQPLDCPREKTYCHYRYPKELLKEFSIRPDNYWIDIGILLVEIIVVRIIAYVTLRRVIKKS